MTTTVVRSTDLSRISSGPGLLPAQAGNADKFLKTDGSTLSWAAAGSGGGGGGAAASPQWMVKIGGAPSGFDPTAIGEHADGHLAVLVRESVSGASALMYFSPTGALLWQTDLFSGAETAGNIPVSYTHLTLPTNREV